MTSRLPLAVFFENYLRFLSYQQPRNAVRRRDFGTRPSRTNRCPVAASSAATRSSMTAGLTAKFIRSRQNHIDSPAPSLNGNAAQRSPACGKRSGSCGHTVCGGRGQQDLMSTNLMSEPSAAAGPTHLEKDLICCRLCVCPQLTRNYRKTANETTTPKKFNVYFKTSPGDRISGTAVDG